jgi:2-polyprenyl-6-methoxyphenol hydroxylase-like FAD-dependent oxidoreductase
MQKICIIGDGMSGLIAAAILGQENIKIDLYSSKEKKIKSKKDNRTTAISENNYKYLLNKFNLQSSKFFWPSKEVNLFYENDNQIKNFLNLKEQNENLMYIFKNNQFIRIIDRIILKNKKIKIVKKKIDKVDFSNGSILVKKQKFNYDLIVLCTGINSDLYKKITINRNIEKNYKEVAITTTIKHRSDIKNARQYFLNEGPLAILPFSNNSFSVVWSIDATFFDKITK